MMNAWGPLLAFFLKIKYLQKSWVIQILWVKKLNCGCFADHESDKLSELGAGKKTKKKKKRVLADLDTKDVFF